MHLECLPSDIVQRLFIRALACLPSPSSSDRRAPICGKGPQRAVLQLELAPWGRRADDGTRHGAGGRDGRGPAA
jgi:hypothetical protein